jgi:hypothetical protein
MKKPKCPIGQHADKLLRGGKRTRCTKCGDVFPCSHACDHFDCRLARGEELPDMVVGFDYADAADVVAEALGRANP